MISANNVTYRVGKKALFEDVYNDLLCPKGILQFYTNEVLKK